MNFTKLFIVLFASLVFFSCNNELNITADWKSIPVVYALIDANEEINYIRVEKAFLDPELSGTEIAQIPDSLYYGPDVTVRITNLDNGSSVNLQRVNLEDEGFIREEGPFATQPNIGYKLKTENLNMTVNSMLKIELISVSDQVMTEAETTVIGAYELQTGQPTDPMKFIEERDVSFALFSDEQAARFYDLRLYFNYNEEDINNPGVINERTLEWVIEREKERKRASVSGDFQTLTVFKVRGEEFYKYLGANLEENSSVSRTFKGIDIRYDAGGQELFDYINIGQANTGITSNQIIATFTNFNNDAVGVFSSRTKLENIESFNLNTETRDSLREGRFTEKLNFN